MDKKLLLQQLLLSVVDTEKNVIPNHLQEMKELWERIVPTLDVDSLSKELLEIEDKYLRLDLLNRKLTDSEKLRPICDTIHAECENADKICLWRGDITSIYTDVIVHPMYIDTSCSDKMYALDSNIFLKSGLRLRTKMKDILHDCSLDVSDVLITRAYNLPCDYIIHVLLDKKDSIVTEEEQINLKMSYAHILECANNNMVKMVVLPTLGLNKKCDPLLASICVQSIQEFLKKGGGIEKVILCTSSAEEYDSYVDIFLGENHA